MNKLDEFFKEKLTDHSIAPSTGAWQKVEAGFSKKNKGVAWLRWAAVFLLGAFLLGTLWMQRENTSAPMAKDNLPLPEIEKENHLLQPAIAKEQPETKSVVSKKKTKTAKTIQPVIQEEIKQAEVKKEEVAQVEVAQVMEKLSVRTYETNPAARQSERGILLTYTLDTIIPPIEEKSEPEAAIVVASTERKGKSFKRMMEFAKNVKNSESPLGELRIKKGELFALDLKKKPTSKK